MATALEHSLAGSRIAEEMKAERESIQEELAEPLAAVRERLGQPVETLPQELRVFALAFE